MNKDIVIEDWGVVDYQTAWDKQEALLKEQVGLKMEGRPTINRLIFVEHPPVYTLGKSGDISNVLLTETELVEKGIAFFKTNRGGDITFHGPGQIVAYPIFDLENFKPDIGWYLRSIEQAVIDTIAEFGIIGARSSGETGVWIAPDIKGKERKICAMGVRCSRWVTMHGLALNVNTDLNYFNYIVPCGIADKKVASMQDELKTTVEINAVSAALANHFKNIFQ